MIKRILVSIIVLLLAGTTVLAEESKANVCKEVKTIAWDFGIIEDLEEKSAWDPLQYNHPRALVVDSQGNLYVGDSVNYRIIKFDSKGKYVLDFKLQNPGKDKSAEMKSLIEKMGYVISSLAIDRSDNIYVLNRYENRVEIYTSTGSFRRSIAIRLKGKLNNNEDQMSVDKMGNLYITNGIEYFTGEGSIYDLLGRPVREKISAREWKKYYSSNNMVGYSGYEVKETDDKKDGLVLLRHNKEVDRCYGMTIRTDLQNYVDRKGNIYGMVELTGSTGNNFVVRILRMRKAR